MVAKCGPIKINHWAHKSRQNCDSWWEAETEWHRSWKDEFPKNWQECSKRDENGELHIADVLTPQGLTLEFQNSPIKRDEVEARTNFHKKICWIVNGLRLKNSLKQFNRAIDEGTRPHSKGGAVYKLLLTDSRLLNQWAGLNAPVVFDFGNDSIWVIGHNDNHFAYVYNLKKNLLVQQLKLGNRPPPIRQI